MEFKSCDRCWQRFPDVASLNTHRRRCLRVCRHKCIPSYVFSTAAACRKHEMKNCSHKGTTVASKTVQSRINKTSAIPSAKSASVDAGNASKEPSLGQKRSSGRLAESEANKKRVCADHDIGRPNVLLEPSNASKAVSQSSPPAHVLPKNITENEESEWILSSNRYSTRSEDLDTLYDTGVEHGISQFKIEASDTALDAYIGSLTSMEGSSVVALRISQTRYFDCFDPYTDDVPLNKLPLPAATKLVLLPCCVVSGHWSLLTYSPKDHMFEFFDPLYAVSSAMIKRVKKIAAAFQTFYDVQVREAKYSFCASCRHQRRGTMNCGIRVAYFAKQLVIQEAFDANACMLEFRQEMRLAVVEHLGNLANSY